MGCYIDKDKTAKDPCALIDFRFRQADSFYIFNHLDITITYHSGRGTEWGPQYGENSGRIICTVLLKKKYYSLIRLSLFLFIILFFSRKSGP